MFFPTWKTWISVLLNALVFVLSNSDENYFGSFLLDSFHIARHNVALKQRKQISDFNLFIKRLIFFLCLGAHILKNNYQTQEEKILNIAFWLCAHIEGFLNSP